MSGWSMALTLHNRSSDINFFEIIIGTIGTVVETNLSVYYIESSNKRIIMI